MSLLARRQPRTGEGLTGRFTVRSSRDRRALRRLLAAALAELAQRAQDPGCRVLEVQLVAQVCAAPSYAEFRRAHERAWRRRGGRYTTANWPARIGEDEYAAVLVPLAAGRVGVAAGRQPRLGARAIFSHGKSALAGGATYDDLVLDLVARWVANPGEGTTARLAPPVIEVVQRGRVVDRRVADFDQSWPLPVPDGV